MVSVDGSIVVQIVNFLLLIWILNMVLYKPIRKILLERKEKIAGLQGVIDGSDQEVVEKKKPIPKAFARRVPQGRRKKKR